MSYRELAGSFPPQEVGWTVVEYNQASLVPERCLGFFVQRAEAEEWADAERNRTAKAKRWEVFALARLVLAEEPR